MNEFLISFSGTGVFFPPILEEEVAALSGTIKSNVSARYDSSFSHISCESQLVTYNIDLNPDPYVAFLVTSSSPPSL